MGRLKTAHDKQREYAKKEYLSGDEQKGDEHAAKAEAFLERILAGEDADAPTNGASEEPTEEPTELVIANLPKSHTAAYADIARYLGIEDADPSEAISSQASEFFEKSADKPEVREALTVLGVFGHPGAEQHPGVDYEPYTRYFEQAPGFGGQNWKPKNESEIGAGVPVWEQFLASKA